MGAERGSRASQFVLYRYCERIRAAEHAPGSPVNVLEHRHGLAEIVDVITAMGDRNVYLAYYLQCEGENLCSRRWRGAPEF